MMIFTTFGLFLEHTKTPPLSNFVDPRQSPLMGVGGIRRESQLMMKSQKFS